MIKTKIIVVIIFTIIVVSIPAILVKTKSKPKETTTTSLTTPKAILTPSISPITTENLNPRVAEEDVNIQNNLDRMDTDLKELDQIDISDETIADL